MGRNRSSWLILWLAILLILVWFLTIFNPSGFWNWINILLWISLILSGISAVINTIQNKGTPYISFLFVIGILWIILWFALIVAREANFVGKLMIWMFALWAFIRWWMLIFFWIQNKENMPLRRGISFLGGILVLLAILTAISSAGMANLVGICIWISIIFDWLSLLFFFVKWWNSLQTQIISQANQNEISQWDIVITETIITNNPDNKIQQ